jgi:aminopeptidase YwaD
MKRMYLWLMIPCIIYAIPGCSSPSMIRALRNDIRILASDSIEGRRSGTQGERRATGFIADEFLKYGLERAGENGTYFQPFEFVTSVMLGDLNSFSITAQDTQMTFVLDRDYRPFGFSADTTITAPLAFLGYGISAPDLKFDEYGEIDVKGKVVIVMANSPDSAQPHGQFSKYSSVKVKIMTAREKGAVGFILIPPPSSLAGDEKDDLPKLRYDFAFTNVGLPCIQMTLSSGTALFGRYGKDLSVLQKEIDSLKVSRSFSFENAGTILTTSITKVKSTARNVIGFLEGTDPTLKNEYIIVGGHHDHLGWGGEGSLAPNVIAIHPGADDNASGTAGILELAREFAWGKKNLSRSILFITFSGEEEGLQGSSYYVKHPTRPLSDAIAMINLDMIGRLKDSAVVINGMGTSALWNDIIPKFNEPQIFNIKSNNDGYGPSDHSSFYGKDIPVLLFFTSLHEDYHRPSDKAERINYDGEEQILGFVSRIIDTLGTMPVRPQFDKVQSSQHPETRGYKVTLGVIPDFTDSEAGMKITGVRPGGPAAKAGLEGGDIIIKMRGKPINNIYDYTYMLGEFKAGDDVEVVVKRNGEEKSFIVRLEKRSN